MQSSFLSSSDFTGMPSSPTKSGEKHKYANQTLRKKKGEVVTRFFFPKQTAAGEVLSAPTFTGSSSCGCIAMGGLLTCVAGAMMRPTG